MGIFIDTYGTSKLNLTNGELPKVEAIFDMRHLLSNVKTRAQSIVRAAYGIWDVHLKPLLKHFLLQDQKTITVELFTWEKTRFC
jgi:S-adenosylmethionine synthetase